jgi:hypothetical protein
VSREVSLYVRKITQYRKRHGSSRRADGYIRAGAITIAELKERYGFLPFTNTGAI